MSNKRKLEFFFFEKIEKMISFISPIIHRNGKTEYLIDQLRTEIRQKRFRLKTCPQGVLQAQQEKSGFFIFTTTTSACISGT